MIIGLTGGIASGKSTVAEIFRQKGINVFDADECAKSLTKDGAKGAKAIFETFGSEFFEGEHLNRRKLAEFVFASKEETEKLNSIIHPLVEEEIKKFICAHSVGVLDVPLLFESGIDKLCDRTICVFCTEDEQILRAVKRSSYSENDVKNRIKRQFTAKEKIALADFCIDTAVSIESTKEQTEKIYAEIINEVR